MDIRLPDGRILKNVPEGTTRAQIEAKIGPIQAAPADAMPAEPPPETTALGGDGENFLAGVGRGMTRAGLALRELGDKAATGLDSAFPAVSRLGQSLGMASPQQSAQDTQAALADMTATDSELMGTKAGKVGNVAGAVAAAAPAMLVPGANSYVGAGLIGAGTGAALTPGGLEERAKSGAFGLVGGVAGRAVGQALGAGARAATGAVQTRLANAQAANAVRDASLNAGRQLGAVAPPSTANPTVMNRLLEGFAGKIRTAQDAAVRNQDVFNSAVRHDLGLAANAPLTPQTLQAVRQTAGQAYQALENVPIQADAAFQRAVQNITSRQTRANAAFPGISNDRAADVAQSLLQTQNFTGGQATATMSILREQAGQAFRAGDATLARALNQASDALEGVIERNLRQSAPTLLPQYQAARQIIARTYTAERALNPATGNIAGQKLAAQLAKGKPLSGQMRQAAQFAGAFPKASREVVESMPVISPLDTATAVMAPHGMGLGVMAGRPLVRSALLSGVGQNALAVPTYTPNAIAQLSRQALQSPVTQNALSLFLANRAAQQ